MPNVIGLREAMHVLNRKNEGKVLQGDEWHGELGVGWNKM